MFITASSLEVSAIHNGFIDSLSHGKVAADSLLLLTWQRCRR